MIYLKTYFYSPNELNFINMSLMEGDGKFDKLILCEFNATHTGMSRDFIFDQYKYMIPEKFWDRIIYLKCDIKKQVVDAFQNEALAHNVNERLMRGFFTSMMDLNDDDVIISVDADEVIYREAYDSILEGVRKHGDVTLKLRPFFYKLNYHWIDNPYSAPMATTYGRHKRQYPYQWRYEGRLLDEQMGCHFSWCMSIDDMMKKLDSFAHVEHRKNVNREIMEKAVKNKEYPFFSRPFNIEVIERDSSLLPKCLTNEFFNNFWNLYS